jgi:Phage integrase family
MGSVLLDVAGHRRSLATMPGYHRGRPPRNRGEQYPADPPTVEEIVAVMSAVGDRADGHRLRALIVLLWRPGLRISEALSLQESDLDRIRGAVLVRRGKGGTRRAVGMDRWPGDQLDPMARDPPRASDRRDAVRDSRTDRGTTLGSVGRAQAVASCRRGRRRETAVRAPGDRPERDRIGSAFGRADPTPHPRLAICETAQPRRSRPAFRPAVTSRAVSDCEAAAAVDPGVTDGSACRRVERSNVSLTEAADSWWGLVLHPSRSSPLRCTIVA